ncbi:helix-turn-helix transcriptional regulator [Bacillus sp. FSL W7-1294]|uniref:helix-turn-helix domain-containing protein n=1 Tax=Bacillus TaxID=1386 RepID=UPI00077A55D5|nr:hypothetical protein AT270_03820 [Bacillus cereus]
MRFKIKETRKKFGDTLQSLAKKVEYDYSNLSKIERGSINPMPINLRLFTTPKYKKTLFFLT